MIVIVTEIAHFYTTHVILTFILLRRCRAVLGGGYCCSFGGSEWLRNFPKATELIMGRAGFHSGVTSTAPSDFE